MAFLLLEMLSSGQTSLREKKTPSEAACSDTGDTNGGEVSSFPAHAAR